MTFHGFLHPALITTIHTMLSFGQTLLSRLKLVQNVAAHLSNGNEKKREPISPVLASLHWLPVLFCVGF